MSNKTKTSKNIKAFGRSRDAMHATQSPVTFTPTKRTARTLPSTLISIQQFCAAYAVGRTRAYELLNDGEIEAIKSGYRTLILMDSVEAWLQRLQPFGANK